MRIGNVGYKRNRGKKSSSENVIKKNCINMDDDSRWTMDPDWNLRIAFSILALSISVIN